MAPGGNVHTLRVLELLPRQQFRVIVDAGCGTGRQTLVLAKKLGTLIHAVDVSEPFLHELAQQAKVAGIEHLVETHCLDMKSIPGVFLQIDLLWSEGAAYNIGFSNALMTWAAVINPEGFAVVSELSWLREEIPDAVREFFHAAYPAMQSVGQNVAVAKNAGYTVLTTYALPREVWVEGYYDVLESRAQALLSHPDASVRDCAGRIVKEIAIFEHSAGNYGYVFCVLQRASP